MTPPRSTHGTALVTGAAGGMGAAHARRLAADGFDVVVTDLERTRGALESLAAELAARPVCADLADPVGADELVAATGAVDVLVANHASMTMAPVTEHDPADFWRVVDTNLGGTFRLVRAVVPGMRTRGGGRIVVVTSEWGSTGWPDAGAYAASKAGLVSLVKTLGRELAPHGILVNAVAPGVVDTPQLDVDAAAAGVTPQRIREVYAAGIPLGRIGRPDEIAAVVSLLADARQGALAGQVLSANGGSTRGRA